MREVAGESLDIVRGTQRDQAWNSHQLGAFSEYQRLFSWLVTSFTLNCLKMDFFVHFIQGAA